MNQPLPAPKPAVTDVPPRRVLFALSALLIAITWAVFWPVLGYDFVEYDDQIYVTENAIVRQGLTAETVRWAATTRDIANWHPVTWLSLMLDVELAGVRPGWMHFVNLLLHTINVCLLFALLASMTRRAWSSFFAAALFAIHPLHVEGVAWISERKDLLAALFGFLAIAAWLRSIESKRWAWRTASLVAYALSLMSKQMLVTLPFVLLLFDVWPLARRNLGWRKLVVEKLPYFALAGAFSWIAFQAQADFGAVATSGELPLWARAANAVYAYAAYLRKTIWPSDLAVFYPHPGTAISLSTVAISAAVLITISALAIWQLRRRPFVFVGWCFYLGTLVPVIGLVQIGEQQLADRYTYIPLIGLFIAAVWLAGSLRFGGRALAGAIGGAAVLACISASWFQVRHWQDTRTLFAQALEVTEHNAIAHNGVGNALHKQGRLEEAVRHYQQAIEITPNFSRAHLNLGIARMQQGRLDEAVEEIGRAAQLDPGDANVHFNYGFVLREAGRAGEAFAHMQTAVELNPLDVLARNNLGNALRERGEHDAALNEWRRAAAIDSSNVPVQINLVEEYTRRGDIALALDHFDQAVAFEPHSALAYEKAGRAYLAAQRSQDALAHFDQAIAINPELAAAHAGRADALAALGEATGAEQSRRTAEQLQAEQTAAATARRAAGLAQYGQSLIRGERWDDAVQALVQAVNLAPREPEIRIELAKAYLGAQNQDAARAELTKILDAHPDHAAAQQLLRQLP